MTTESTKSNYIIRPATPSDIDGIVSLMPRLAGAFSPPRREPEHIYSGDTELLVKWAQGTLENASSCIIFVASDAENGVAALAFARTRQDIFSYEPSCHLESLVVRQDAEGQGLARRLVQSVEKEAKERGAKTMSLHVFPNNLRARDLYEKQGFHSELVRYVKFMD